MEIDSMYFIEVWIILHLQQKQWNANWSKINTEKKSILLAYILSTNDLGQKWEQKEEGVSVPQKVAISV